MIDYGPSRKLNPTSFAFFSTSISICFNIGDDRENNLYRHHGRSSIYSFTSGLELNQFAFFSPRTCIVGSATIAHVGNQLKLSGQHDGSSIYTFTSGISSSAQLTIGFAHAIITSDLVSWDLLRWAAIPPHGNHAA